MTAVTIEAGPFTCGGCGKEITREATENGWRDNDRDLWCPNGELYEPVTETDPRGEPMTAETPSVSEHLRHMSDGRWHDGCRYCLNRRAKGGTGVPADQMADYEKSRGMPARGLVMGGECGRGDCGFCRWPHCGCLCHEPEVAGETPATEAS